MNSNSFDMILESAKWTGNSVPYSYVITKTDLAASSLCDILFNPQTDKTVSALADYKIAGYKQETGKVTIYAWGEKPSIDLPITFVVRGGL